MQWAPSHWNTAFGDVFFYGDGTWRSDGTVAGTRKLTDVYFGRMVQVGDLAFFQGSDFATGSLGSELWVTDGTTEGTMLLKDIRPGPASSNPSHLLNLGGTLLFVAEDGVHGLKLWRSDGTAAGTTLLKDVNPGPAPLWDGMLAYEPIGVVAGSTVFFSAANGVHGMELWRTDGTAAGTVMVRDGNPGAANAFLDRVAYPQGLTAMNGLVYFRADEPQHGTALWRSDGTAAGTWLVADIDSGFGWSTPNLLTPVGATLFMSADPNSAVSRAELWKSDGTAAGTVRVSTAVGFQLSTFGNRLLFGYGDLWTSDGTPGNRQLANIRPGPESPGPPT